VQCIPIQLTQLTRRPGKCDPPAAAPLQNHLIAGWHVDQVFSVNMFVPWGFYLLLWMASQSAICTCCRMRSIWSVSEWQSQIVMWLHFSLAKEMVRYVLFHILHFVSGCILIVFMDYNWQILDILSFEYTGKFLLKFIDPGNVRVARKEDRLKIKDEYNNYMVCLSHWNIWPVLHVPFLFFRPLGE
jgi:hypothetical protein